MTDMRRPHLWLRQNNLIHAGLIGIGLILVQPFLAAPLGLTALISVVAFAISVPLNAIMLMVNQLAEQLDYDIVIWPVAAAKGVAMLSGCVGVVVAFWHMHWIAGTGILVGGVFAVLVYTAVTSSRFQPGDQPIR